MSNPFNRLDRDFAEAKLKYGYHNPKQRKVLEDYLTKENQLLKKQSQNLTSFFYPNVAKKKVVQQQKIKKPINIDISLPPELTKLLEDK